MSDKQQAGKFFFRASRIILDKKIKKSIYSPALNKKGYMKKMQVNITVEYNNIEDPNGLEAEEIIQNLNLKVTQGLIQDAANANNVNVEDVRIIND